MAKNISDATLRLALSQMTKREMIDLIIKLYRTLELRENSTINNTLDKVTESFTIISIFLIDGIKKLNTK